MLLSATPPVMLVVAEEQIRRHSPGNALGVCWRQWRAERALARQGIRFRFTDPEEVAAGYVAMTAEEFDAVNARQDWANWRTIPRCLSGNVPDMPLRILDLGCGTGGSTRVLAWYAPPGSHVTGFEMAEPLVAIARRRTYPDRSGGAARVDFVCQGVTEPLRDGQGSVVADGSVDAVNASGIVGHHLGTQKIEPLPTELRRVLRPGGIAMLDVGPTLRERELTRLLGEAGFCKLGHCRSWWFDPTGQVIFRR
jgi:SAM-dependent methyltransferase